MTSEPDASDMSLKVESSPTSWLPSSSFDDNSSSDKIEAAATTVSSYQMHLQTSQQEGGSIVGEEKPPQNFSRNNFAEHLKFDTTQPPPSQDVMATSSQSSSLHHQNTTTTPFSPSQTTPSSTLPFLATAFGGTGSNIINNNSETFSWGVDSNSAGDFFTTPTGSHSKPAELFPGFHAKQQHGTSSLATNTIFPQHHSQQQPHQLNQLLPQPSQTPQRPPIQQHAATAAEIALGLPSSSFNQYQAMGDGTRSSTGGTRQRTFETKSDASSLDCRKDGEEESSRTEDTFVVSSPGRMTPLHDSSDHGSVDPHRLAMVVGTPSTVSTAPSSDDASLGTDYKLDDSVLPNLLHPLGQQHRRASSWDDEAFLPTSGVATPPRHFGGEQIAQNPWTTPSSVSVQGPHHMQHGSWGSGPLLQHPQPPPQQQRVATFRNDAPWGKHVGPQQLHPHMNVLYPHQRPVAYQQHPSQTPQQVPQQQQQGSRKQTYAHQAAAHHPPPPPGGSQGIGSPSAGTTKGSRPQRPQNARAVNPMNPNAGLNPSTSNSRSASEILKTLLRKKACLYEPDTSRSVALITWLVGRELALEHGFFSRQQLQSGVHACVSEKIESGTITRTKVNRCMQIILNSCFHYIIPRVDGTEENGDYFRAAFAVTVQDDLPLLRHLPEPWNDLSVEKQAILEASQQDGDEKASISEGKSPSATPKTSPRLSSANAEKSPDRDHHDGDESKRSVLLCFNENVRSAEDVFRCHNEFIRDTANAAHLQLTAQEWRQFFGREASRAPYLWGNIGIPTLTGESAGGPPRQLDLLGQMCSEELAKFRSTWCAKRYDHDHDLCGFAHIEVNGGWLRRNPLIYSYKDEMCQFISTAVDETIGPSHFFLNECPKGIHCEYAHSMEEIVYHPNCYKTKVCTSLYSQSRGCRTGDVCPNLHPPDITKPMRKSEILRSQGNRRHKQDQSNASAKTSPSIPMGSPVVYANPAPYSSFDHLLGMPGLQSLFRRQSAVVRAHIRSSGKTKCFYSPFGDEWGISHPTAAPGRQRGQPKGRT
jgi:hypothetical protein